MKVGAATLLIIATLSVAGGSQPISLQQLERKVQNSPQELAAVAELEQSLSHLEAEQAASGLKLYAGVSNGIYQEAKDEDSIRNYNQASLRMGLRYPLLGTRWKEQINVAMAEARTLANRQKTELARRMALNALRSHYCNYWNSARRIELSRAFLGGREILEDILAQRKSKGLLLDGDRQEFLTAFYLAERHIANALAVQKRALGIINMLTHSDFAELHCLSPTLPQPCSDETAVKSQILDSHPELVLRRGLVEEQTSILKLQPNADVDANLDVGGSASLDYPSGQPGYGVAVSFNMQFPAGIKTVASARERAARAGLRKRSLELDQKAQELVVDAVETLEKYRAAQTNTAFARQRVKSAQETLRENQLRAAYLPGDTIEKVQQSRFQYYMAGLDLVDAEMIQLQAQAALLQLAPQECGGTLEPTPAPAGKVESAADGGSVTAQLLAWPKSSSRSVEPASGVSRGDCTRSGGNTVYHWESGDWLNDSLPKEADWESLSKFGIDRILISLDRRQIEAVETPDGRRRLSAFLEAAHGRGFRVELLLGEPLWILPEDRPQLLEIIKHLRGFSFDGLHLDLEPDQLDTKVHSREYLWAQLIATLQAVAAVNPWPLGVSVHPRYFDRGEMKTCPGCALTQLPVAEVVLMAYVSDPEKVARRVAPILASNPKQCFSIAVSVEPSLSPAESYHSQGWVGLQSALDALRGKLPYQNFRSIVIQSWTYLKPMRP